MSNWSELAAMLAVLGFFGSVFTGIVYFLIDRKFNAFREDLRNSFVTRETYELRNNYLAAEHLRHDREIAEVWSRINALGDKK